jgi:hypothetical protein
MDSINDRNFELLNKQIIDLQNTKAQLNNNNEEQENIIFKTSARTITTNKKLYILKTNDNKYKIS